MSTLTESQFKNLKDKLRLIENTEPVPQEVIDKLKPIVLAVWNDIGPDVEELIYDPEGDYDDMNESAIEMCMDANRLEAKLDDDPYLDSDLTPEQIQNMYRTYGWRNIVLALTRQVRII